MKRKQTRLDKYHSKTEDAEPRLRTLDDSSAPSHSADTMRGRTLVGLACCVAILVVVVGLVAPTFGHGFQPAYLVVVAVLAAAAYFAVREGMRDDRVVRICLVVAVVFSALFVAGARDQVVIDGVVYSASSRQARGNELVSEVYESLTTMSSYDQLLSLEQADGRARFSEFEPARDDLIAIATKWSRRDLGGLPDPDFIDIVTTLKVAATFGAEAVQIRFNLLTEPDQRAQQALFENRSTFTSGVLDAGARLAPLAQRYHVDLRTVTE